ncbi:MAG: glycosyltransferase family 4 protein [Planctomycetaceae bacterium]|nr:glycosyltransferase family 4 protein [Planctomycetaceae bacterium]
MRILFFCHYYPPEVNAPASRTSEHCARWAAAGHEVTVVTCVPNCPDGVVFDGYRNRFRKQVEHIDGVRVVRIWTYVAPNSGTVRRILNYVSFMVSAIWTCLWLPRPDVVIATSPQFFCGWAGVWASRIKRRPFVLEIRDIWPESIQAVGAMQKGLAVRYLEWLERRMYLAADHIVAVGEGYRDRIIEKVPVTDRISVIMNGVDLDKFSPDGVDGVDEFRTMWHLTDRFVCSYIGTIGMAHGLDVVLDAAAKLKAAGRDDVAFLLVGDGARRAELESSAQKSGLSDTVIFAGRQPREMIPAVLAASDACLIHLKATELFDTVIPSKIFETMAMSRPIIMGVRGEALDIVMQAQAGVEMRPESSESLLAAIDQIREDDQMSGQMRTTAVREFVAAHYSRTSMAQRFLDLLIKLSEESRSVDDLQTTEHTDEQSTGDPKRDDAGSPRPALMETTA